MAESSEEEVQVNPLEMSDEDILNMPAPTEPTEEEKPDETAESDTEEGEVAATDLEDSTEGDNPDESESDEEEAKEKEGSDDDEPEGEEKPDGKEESAADDTDPKELKKEKVEKKVEPTKDEAKEAKTVTDADKIAGYERVLGNFRANGKDIKVDNIDDVISLMQMGANFNKKMAALKPNLKLMKMLENNELLDEAKLSYLIDLDKKDPTAIAKLIKDSGINPLEVDVSADPGYKPKTYSVGDKEVELDQVLVDIQATPTYQKTVDVVSNKWDEASKNIILGEPSIIATINDHMASGVYDQIAARIDKERMLGRLSGVSDIQAYKEIGSAMHAAKEFKGQEETPPAKEETPAKVADLVKPKVEDDLELTKRKKAASSTQSRPAKGKKSKDFNPLAMSDDDFEKSAMSHYA